MALSKKQLGLIHVAKKQLGLKDDDYRALLSGVAGVSSSKELDAAGFDQVMESFKRLGFKSSRDDFGDRYGKATAAQISYIRGLWADFANNQDDKALNKWLSAKYGVSALRFLDVATASKAIEGLKKMTTRKTPTSAKQTKKGANGEYGTSCG